MSMTRQEYLAAVAKIEAYYDAQLQPAIAAVANAQAALETVQQSRKQALRRLDDYRDALKKKSEIDAIIAAGPPAEAEVGKVVVAMIEEAVVANG